MLSVEQALQLVEGHVQPLAPRRVPLSEAAGLVLADDVASDVDSPPHDKAMMDGYAVVSSDRTPVRKVVEEIAAGHVPRYAVTPGAAARIMTGAPLPEGADAVIPVEKTAVADNDNVRLNEVESRPGQHVLVRGASMKAGHIVVRAGTILRPIDLAILAEAGGAMPLVQPRPRVAVLPTGNELVAVDQKPTAGQIRNSNGPLLLAAAVVAGAEAIDLGVARDDRDDIHERIRQGLAADVLVLSGGVSAGKFDLVPAVLAELNVEQVFHKVSLRPGQPLWFGVHASAESRTLVFGLPGNPVSSFVCFELFVRPAVAALAGRGFAVASLIAAKLTHEYQHQGGRVAFVPAHIEASKSADATPLVAILPWQGSADLVTLAQANALVRLGAEAVRLPQGASVDALRI